MNEKELKKAEDNLLLPKEKIFWPRAHYDYPALSKLLERNEECREIMKEYEKELYKEYYKQLRAGDTNMGYEAWKLSNEIINREVQNNV